MIFINCDSYMKLYPFVNNSASHMGGVIQTVEHSQGAKDGVTYSMANLSVSIFNCSFTNNSASDDGVIGIFSTQSPLRIINCTIDSNTAPQGGVLALSGSLTDIINCTIRNNIASLNGGVIVTIYETHINITTGNSSFNIINTNFTNNSAAYGGVIAVGGESFINISKCTISSNRAH